MNAPLWIDLALIAIFVLCVVIGARRGALRAVAGLVSSVVGLVGAIKLSPAISPVIAKIIAPFLAGTVKKAALSAGVDGILSSPVAHDTYAGFVKLFEALKLPNASADALFQSAADTSEKLSRAAGDALAARIAPILAFLAVFVALQLAVRVLASLLSHDGIPVLSSLNRMLGGLLGALTGAVVVLVLCWGALTYAPAEDIGLLNRHTLEQSRIGGALAELLIKDEVTQ